MHKLSQEKIFIVGPPGSGKTFHSQKYCVGYLDFHKNTIYHIFISKESLTKSKS